MSRTVQTQSGDTSTETSRLGLVPTTAIALVAALVAVSIVFFIAQAATDNLLVTPFGGDEPQDIGLGAVLFTSVLGAIVGALLAWAVGRFVPRPRLTFVAICNVGLVLYGIVPFIAAEETATAVWLNLMHLAVALPIVGGLAIMHLPESRR